MNSGIVGARLLVPDLNQHKTVSPQDRRSLEAFFPPKTIKTAARILFSDDVASEYESLLRKDRIGKSPH
jgi:hypothetical protein